MTTSVTNRLLRVNLFGILFFLCAVLPTSAEEADPNAPKLDRPNFQYKTVKTKEGLVFQVPSDMPIEIRNGIQAPIPFDEYTYGKFGHLEAKLSRMDERLSRIEEKLDRLAPLLGAASSVTTSVAVAAPVADSTGILKAGIE